MNDRQERGPQYGGCREEGEGNAFICQWCKAVTNQLYNTGDARPELTQTYELCSLCWFHWARVQK